MLDSTDDDAANEIDGDDDQTRDRITLDELHGAVHRSIELALALQPAPPAPGLDLVDVTVAKVGVDAHLLARQRIEREPRGNFGNAFRPFGDHDELDDRDDQEHHEPNDDVARDDE